MMPRYEGLPDELRDVPLEVGQIRLTTADMECEILEISGAMVKMRILGVDARASEWSSAQSYIQRTTKFLRMKGAAV